MGLGGAIGSGLAIYRVGITGGEAWLLRSERSAVLVEAGLPFYGRALAEEVRERLHGVPLAAILVTHSHYDHAGGLARVKAAFPQAVTVAAPHAAYVMKREGALKAMRELNRLAADLTQGEFAASDDDVGGYVIDHEASDGDRMDAGGFLIEVLDTPGHTNDSLSFWFPNEGIVALSETTGVFFKCPEMLVEPAFVVSWEAALAATERVEKIKPDVLIVPHTGVLTGDEAPHFLSRQKEEILFTKDLVLRLDAEGRDEADIMDAIRSRYYDRRPASFRDFMPLPSYMLNVKAMVARLLGQCS
ncbi:MAG: MBL fold metallo-hydrolase [Clostridiales bacterium]|nr:MBL fold metallo-hydrolase [Clostridiales bacterium]